MIRIKDQAKDDRTYWLQTMCKIADPVLLALSEKRLKSQMPIEAKMQDRDKYSHLEAFARLLSGIAPWLETGPIVGKEGQTRKKYAELSRLCIDAATDPNSEDYMNFAEGHQPIVDTAFLAHAIIRAPKELYEKLEPRVQTNLVRALKLTRTRKPFFNNWLLFSAMIETALFQVGEEWDLMRIDYALKQHEQWYVGDGTYKDGPELHMDYYNSFVIQPMMVDIIERLADHSADWEEMKERVISRAKRFAIIQERSISPEGTFPVVGRSLAYRFGAFQHLAQMALQHKVEENLQPAQIRCALTAVIRRIIEMPGTFDEAGWLRIGLCGHQPELGEAYISTGSLYLCATVFLPLGLPENDPFWQGEAEWTSKKAWSGMAVPIDSSL
ncbi:DUF2264 domain-containing protein [Lederbergia lenta]|uniref:Uncharacterized protein conserved in bacteria n=1 Tax=Lederbergia lenta TaxID=1467 RepID=A0A2X4VU35_LEDLE|nr:DUF2264 domain-containing protein [Lederbergia lenta]MCM3110872.1 DUF2264 domain-containing protein [Lederbergia lenta]MEC2325732.1 DUF2264 domain-containing protein [Lederbergia lenta]SQI53839.1 Uncharacterized protein conserved in bacteria [Lederbergia lenta]